MNILKSILALSFLMYSLVADSLLPQKSLTASAGVNDLVMSNNKLYVATNASKVDIFDWKTKELDYSITLPKIKDFMGDSIESKIYSVDIIQDKILILSLGEKGGRNIDIYQNGKLTNIISSQQRLFIAKAKFIDENKIIFSLLSNQLYLYDLAAHKKIYSKQISQSKFSDFVLNENKNEIVIADESGNLQQYDTIKGVYLASYENQNLDNVFQVDYKKGIILTAGQDRRAVVYKGSQPYYKKSDFLIYSCGLSPSGNLAGYSSNENNDVSIFNTQTKKELYTLKGNKMTLTTVLFVNENEVLVSSDDKNINYYKLNN